MSKRFTKLIAAFAATMTMLPASAQVMPENQVPLTPSRILPGQKTAQQKVDPLKAFPTLLAKTLPRDVKSPFSSPTIAIRPADLKNLVTVNPDHVGKSPHQQLHGHVFVPPGGKPQFRTALRLQERLFQWRKRNDRRSASRHIPRYELCSLWYSPALALCIRHRDLAVGRTAQERQRLQSDRY